ncbi:MAG TPA: metalloregulator ArsR/SmtB family transcription factor [Anaerohalosphaeraceae bacterium]|nr:metalloregulator ArsR/SmtB family transcription factor [Anaerohalosphaeraceae bacterium]HOL88866.1 metalloregulator ArsR/SmtB family transcription factor [Anaerohalosphaeraceae bacterium]HPP55708.1 metalloregulator ArsR/SmtB family transcription factor [Anaerohalosphaeraceae bacterium]
MEDEKLRPELLELYEKQALVTQAMAHPLRIAILHILRQGPCCVQDIVRQVGGKQSNISRHLGILVNAGILQYEKKGLHVYYTLKRQCVLRFLDCLSDYLKEQIEMDKKLLQII